MRVTTGKKEAIKRQSFKLSKEERVDKITRISIAGVFNREKARLRLDTHETNTKMRLFFFANRVDRCNV